MQEFFPILRRSVLFQGLNDAELSDVLGCLNAQPADYAKNQVILAQGAHAQAIGVLLHGSAQISRIDYEGNRSIVTSLGPAQIFAEAFACQSDLPLSVSVVATTDCTVLLLDFRRLITTCSQACVFHSRIILHLLQALAAQNLLLNQKLEILSQRSTRQKLLTYLQQQALTTGSSTFCIPYNRQELADFLEVDRSGLSTVISQLEREGQLIAKRQQFTLLSTN